MRRAVMTIVFAVLGLLVPSGATASPIFNLDIRHNQTNFPPGGNQVDAEAIVFSPTQGSAGQNEKQSFVLEATSGTFTVSFDPDGDGPAPPDPPSADLPFDTSAAVLDAALESLPSIGSSNVAVSFSSGGSGEGSFNIEFTGALGFTDVAPLIVGDGSAPLNINPEYWIDIANVGPDPTSGPLTLTLTLPAGVTRRYVVTDSNNRGAMLTWSCPGSVGDKVIVCTTNDVLGRHEFDRSLKIAVDVADNPALEGIVRTASAKLTGGGASEATAKEPALISSTPAPFGIVASSFVPDFLQADGLTPEREAGAHPDLLVVPFDFNSIDRPKSLLGDDQKGESDSIRNIHVDTPPGFVGNPSAVGECPQADLTLGTCPASSQVGRIEVQTDPPVASSGDYQTFNRPVYNMTHPRGSVSDLAIVLGGNPVHIRASLDPANRYAITTHVPDINETLPPLDQKLTIWGVPADHSHDPERCRPEGGSLQNIDASEECSTDLEPRPFLSLPSQCEEDNVMRLHHYDSWQDPGVYGPDLTYAMPGKMEDCDKPRFEPSVEVEPTGKQANTPTGLDVHIKVAQNENPNALATPPVKRISVTLPEGMSFSPSFADGLQSCTEAQFGISHAGVPDGDPVACPDASRIGEVEVQTPLLPERLEGSMYLAAQGANPFDSLFALYLALHDTEERGVLLKIPGRIDVDEAGNITTSFDDNPQFPFDDFVLKFRSGPRAPLVSPPTCGTHEIGVEVTSYAQPDVALNRSNTYQINEGPNGTPCPGAAASRPFAPKFRGGSLNPVAGSFSTFLFRLSREDQEQELSQVTTVLPPGLVAKIAGIPHCSEQALASISTALGTGALEQASPACPAASAIGTVSAGLGAGPGPNYFGGTVYLAGPYKGAPLSLVVVTPGLAGPFDLGNVVVRVALRVDPDTTRVTAVSDPFPTILHGVILRIRDVRLRIDRPETTLNPTNCNPTSLDAQITGVGGDLLSTLDDFLTTASDYFQVGDCGRLPFKPLLFFKLKGGTHRGDHPAFFARLKARPGDANIARAVTALPRSEFLENAHIKTVCTRVQFRADACPAASIYGHAKAITPLLDDPVEGDLILRSSDNPLPDLVARLRGQISANLIGRIDSVNGGIRTTFATVPDVPVTEFTLTMAGGKKGLLVNSTNLCRKAHRADVRFTAQNGKKLRLRPVMQNSCKKKGRKGKRAKRRG
jgi:hypothetical protein